MAQPVRVKPALPAAKVSKNQRSGPKIKPADKLCTMGHKIVDVIVVGKGMTYQCECTGYKAIDTSVPYQQRKSKIKTGGKARIWFEQPSGA